MFKKNNIRKGVISIIDKKIDEAQTKYEEGAEKLEEQKELDIMATEVKCELDKSALEKQLIEGIIGKLA